MSTGVGGMTGLDRALLCLDVKANAALSVFQAEPMHACKATLLCEEVPLPEPSSSCDQKDCQCVICAGAHLTGSMRDNA